MKKNSEVLEHVVRLTGVANTSQLADYLSDKYGVSISRQQLNQFKAAERQTVTHLLLREALEHAGSDKDHD